MKHELGTMLLSLAKANANDRMSLEDYIKLNKYVDFTKVNSISKTKYTPEFNSLWASYPNRKADSKNGAYTKWLNSLKIFTAEEIIAGCMNYANAVDDKNYIKALSTLLNGQKFANFIQHQQEIKAESAFEQYSSPRNKLNDKTIELNGVLDRIGVAQWQVKEGVSNDKLDILYKRQSELEREIKELQNQVS